MLLSKLFENAPDIEIENLMTHSEQTCENAIFFCIKGMTHDGHDFVGSAIRHGAIVVVHSEELDYYNDKVTYIKVKDTLKTLNICADLFYNHPSNKLRIFSVTGTSGKTSVSMMLRNMINQFDTVGYFGSLGIIYPNYYKEFTTDHYEIPYIHKSLALMRDNDIHQCVLELTSVGIDQHRFDSIDHDVAIFTNIAKDNLEYHGTFEHYLNAKKMLFDNLKENKLAIYNIDDEYGNYMVQDTLARKVSFGIEKPADYRAKNIRINADSLIFVLEHKNKEYLIKSQVLGQYNVYNILAIIASLHESNYDLEEIIEMVKNLKEMSGRMERVSLGQPYNVYIDFAHTLKAFEKIFEFAAKITPNKRRIIVVFGMVGKRNLKKRADFGKLADKYCDMIILTEDDSRGENVFNISEDIAKGIKKTNYITIESRYDAIYQAIEMANPDDTILILGKGDEKFIIKEFGREDWIGDCEVVTEAIKANQYVIEEENYEL